MMRNGIAMRDADDTDLALYLRILAFTGKHDRKKKPDPRADQNENTAQKGAVIELRRGTIDEFFG